LLLTYTTRSPAVADQTRATRKHAKNCSNSTCLRCQWQYWSIFIRLAVVASEICEIPRNSLKIQTYISSKVIDLGVNRKRICNFLLVINSNFGRISYSFRDIDTLSLFSPPHHRLTPPSGGTPCTINIIYTSLKSTFSGLQFCRRHYGFIFIHLAIVAFQNCKIMRNSDKIWPYSSSRSSKVILLGVNLKLICELLVNNSNFGPMWLCYHFWDIDA